MSPVQVQKMHRDAQGAAIRRILFLPHNQRTAYFVSLLDYAHCHANCRIAVVCDEASRKTFMPLIDHGEDLFFIPDFSRQADWENDPDEGAAVDGIIARCEDATGISVNRIILAGERDIGRAYGQASHDWFTGRLGKQALADNSFPGRAARRIFRFADDVLTQYRPDAVLAGHTASPLYYAVMMIARTRGIPVYVNRPSKVISGRCFWTDSDDMINRRGTEFCAELATIGTPASERARKLIESFRQKPVTVDYILQNWKTAASGHFLKMHRRVAQTAVANAAHLLRRRNTVAPKPAVAMLGHHYRSQFRTLSQRRFFQTFDESSLADMSYIYFPMHREPELALNHSAYSWHDQKATVSLLSSVLPAGWKLLVREHRFNIGRRSTAYYRELASLPGVVLLDAFDAQFKYVKNAAIVVTENGSSGWEGLLLGRPVITLSYTFYDSTGLAIRVRDPLELNAAILRCRARKASIDHAEYDRRLGWLIDSEWESTVPDDVNAASESWQSLLSITDMHQPRTAKALQG